MRAECHTSLVKYMLHKGEAKVPMKDHTGEMYRVVRTAEFSKVYDEQFWDSHTGVLIYSIASQRMSMNHNQANN